MVHKLELIKDRLEANIANEAVKLEEPPLERRGPKSSVEQKMFNMEAAFYDLDSAIEYLRAISD